jgi:hypothetical protein
MQEKVMHIPIKPERQRRRALRVLLEVEEFHVAQCECPESCKMLRELREEIAWLRHQRHRKRFKCREGCSPTRTHQTCDRFVVRTCYIGKTGRLPFRRSDPSPTVNTLHFVNPSTFNGLAQQPADEERNECLHCGVSSRGYGWNAIRRATAVTGR